MIFRLKGNDRAKATQRKEVVRNGDYVGLKYVEIRLLTHFHITPDEMKPIRESTKCLEQNDNENIGGMQLQDY